MSLFYWLLLLLVFFFLIHTLRQLKRRHSTPPPWYRDIYSFFPWRVIFKSPPRLAPLTFRSYRFSIPLIGDSIGFLVNPYNFIRSRFEKYGKYSRATLFGRYHLLRNHSLTPITLRRLLTQLIIFIFFKRDVIFISDPEDCLTILQAEGKQVSPRLTCSGDMLSLNQLIYQISLILPGTLGTRLVSRLYLETPRPIASLHLRTPSWTGQRTDVPVVFIPRVASLLP